MSEAECRKDIECASTKYFGAAVVACKPGIEAQAKHDVRWNDGMFNPMFTRNAFSTKYPTAIAYIGDKASFQNGFGAYTPVTYICLIDMDTEKLITVSISEGRLPQS